MSDRAARYVVIGPPFKNKAGEMQVPRALIHPCFKDGCDENAPWGFGKQWACHAHRNELSTLFDQATRIATEHRDAGSTGDRDLLGG